VSVPQPAETIFETKAPWKNARLVLRKPADDRNPAWSPDGRWIAFERSASPAGDPQIYLVNRNGSGLRRVRTFKNGAFDPAWSSSGEKLAFERSIRWTDANGRAHAQSDIFVMTRTGQSVRNLTNDPHNSGFPAWSPDGKTIAFASETSPQGDKSFEIFVMREDGSGRQQLTTDNTLDVQPAWSPDGSRIAFVKLVHDERIGSNLEIFIMNRDGTCQTRVTNTAADESHVTWRPSEGALRHRIAC
jgi:TolB protein